VISDGAISQTRPLGWLGHFPTFAHRADQARHANFEWNARHHGRHRTAPRSFLWHKCSVLAWPAGHVVWLGAPGRCDEGPELRISPAELQSPLSSYRPKKAERDFIRAPLSVVVYRFGFCLSARREEQPPCRQALTSALRMAPPAALSVLSPAHSAAHHPACARK